MIGADENCYAAVELMMVLNTLLLVCLNSKHRVTGLIRASDLIFATWFDPKGATALQTMRTVKVPSGFKYAKPEYGPKKRLCMMKEYGTDSFPVINDQNELVECTDIFAVATQLKQTDKVRSVPTVE